jgi:hypothetical protein
MDNNNCVGRDYETVHRDKEISTVCLEYRKVTGAFEITRPHHAPNKLAPRHPLLDTLLSVPGKPGWDDLSLNFHPAIDLPHDVLGERNQPEDDLRDPLTRRRHG